MGWGMVNNYKGTHKLYVVEGTGPTLLGWNWLCTIPLEWASIKAISKGGFNVDTSVESTLRFFKKD